MRKCHAEICVLRWHEKKSQLKILQNVCRYIEIVLQIKLTETLHYVRRKIAQDTKVGEVVKIDYEDL